VLQSFLATVVRTTKFCIYIELVGFVHLVTKNIAKPINSCRLVLFFVVVWGNLNEQQSFKKQKRTNWNPIRCLGIAKSILQFGRHIRQAHSLFWVLFLISFFVLCSISLGGIFVSNLGGISNLFLVGLLRTTTTVASAEKRLERESLNPQEQYIE